MESNSKKFVVVKNLYNGEILQNLNPKIRKLLIILLLNTDDENKVMGQTQRKLAKEFNVTAATITVWFKKLTALNLIKRGGTCFTPLYDLTPLLEVI